MHETCVIPTDVMKYLNKDWTWTEHIFQHFGGPQGFFGEELIIFTELKNTGNYFRGAKEQAHNYGYKGSTAKKLRKNRSGIWGD